MAMPELFAPRLFPLSRNATLRANGFLPLLPCPHGWKVLKGPMLNSHQKKFLLPRCALFPAPLLCPPAHVRRSPPAVKVAPPVAPAATMQAAPHVRAGMPLVAAPLAGNAPVVLVAPVASALAGPVDLAGNAPVVLVGSAPWVPAQLPAAVPRLLLPLPRLIANRAAKSATRVAAP